MVIGLEKENKEIEILKQNELIVGNEDSILMFGCEAQQRLSQFSKTISNQLFSNNGNLEYLIHDTLKEIDDFQRLIEKKSGIVPAGNKKKRRCLIKKYDAILVYMDKMELALKLQEAQLIKDSKIFEKLCQYIDETLLSLEMTITYGNELINKKPNDKASDDIMIWYERLSKRVEALDISHTIALQTKIQMKMMLENNAQLTDKIMGAVSGTIPVWRNQITILLGIEKVNQNLKIQKKVAEVIQGYITKEKPMLRKNHIESADLCIEELSHINRTLKNTLDVLDSMEKKDVDLKLELNSTLR